MRVRPMRWEDGTLWLLDQRLLPAEETWLPVSTWQQAAGAIADMAVRGAPAIGIAGAYALALAARDGEDLKAAARGLLDSRPTAVNLAWAIERIQKLSNPTFAHVLAEAEAIESEDLTMNQAIGRHGAELIPQGATVLTICNTGALATAGHGTALGIIRTAFGQGKGIFVYACETRPRLQGLRLTAWELAKEGIPFRVIADSAAASLMKEGKIQAVIAGADRIAANGDTANKIGTYSLAVLSRHHGIPLYIAAPTSTIDTKTKSGEDIPIEQRAAEEVTEIAGIRIAPKDCPVENPAFDVTPAELITAIVTDQAVFQPPYRFA